MNTTLTFLMIFLGMIGCGYLGYKVRDEENTQTTQTEYRVYQNADGSSNVVIHYTRYDKTDTYTPLTADDIIKLKAENVQVTDKPVRKKKPKDEIEFI